MLHSRDWEKLNPPFNGVGLRVWKETLPTALGVHDPLQSRKRGRHIHQSHCAIFSFEQDIFFWPDDSRPESS